MIPIQYIKGCPARPAETINELVKRGGRDVNNAAENMRGDGYYYIGKNRAINFTCPRDTLYDMLREYGEEIFIEPKYKFQVGETVRFACLSVHTVTKQINSEGHPRYQLDHRSEVDEDVLEHYDGPKIYTWCDMIDAGVLISGFFINDNNNIKQVKPEESYPAFTGRDLFYSRQQVYSASAAPKITQLIECEKYGGYVPVGVSAYYIAPMVEFCPEDGTRIYPQVYEEPSCSLGGLLRFYDKESAETFLKHNRVLVNEYLML